MLQVILHFYVPIRPIVRIVVFIETLEIDCAKAEGKGNKLEEKHDHGDPEPDFDHTSMTVCRIQLRIDQFRVYIGVLVCTFVDNLEVVEKFNV